MKRYLVKSSAFSEKILTIFSNQSVFTEWTTYQTNDKGFSSMLAGATEFDTIKTSEVSYSELLRTHYKQVKSHNLEPINIKRVQCKFVLCGV